MNSDRRKRVSSRPRAWWFPLAYFIAVPIPCFPMSLVLFSSPVELLRIMWIFPLGLVRVLGVPVSVTDHGRFVLHNHGISAAVLCIYCSIAVVGVQMKQKRWFCVFLLLLAVNIAGCRDMVQEHLAKMPPPTL